MSYAALMVISNFSFLQGASHPEELVDRACALGLKAIAIGDINSFAGIVRAHTSARKIGIQNIVSTRLHLDCGQEIIALPKTRAAYGRLCRLLTIGKRRAEKGQCNLSLDDVCRWSAESCLIIIPKDYDDSLPEKILTLKKYASTDLFLGLVPAYDGLDRVRFTYLDAISSAYNIPKAALGNVMMHIPQRRALADILSCIRLRTTIDRLGLTALSHDQNHLQLPEVIKVLFRDHPDALENSLAIARLCQFSLDELKYEYPDEITKGEMPNNRLRKLTEAGLNNRYPSGIPEKVRTLVEKEFELIKELDYARYFLTVHDIVNFARSQGILCQGRGSAANSVICYALGMTSIGPDIISMVFERFVSKARNEPPDIDVDFEHERREEVIQYIYEKYGRHRAGICATIIHFRSRAAIREVGKAMGLSQDIVAAMASDIWGWSGEGLGEDQARRLGVNPDDPHIRRTLSLARELIGFPRHLSQHVGGFIITRDRLDTLCPIENAAMQDRTVIEWDKNDIDTLGMLKVDILSLGMLSCLRRAFDLLRSCYGLDYDLASLPAEDPAVYDMLCKGDSVGLFQVESRAQMNFLPRMKPRCFYDLVIEVAIVRPGPIQGDMVHPYLKRRNGDEVVEYPSPALEEVLRRTLGVPLFQEQAMQIAIVAGGFDAGEADNLRRSLGAFRGPGSVEKFRDRFIAGALAKGYDHRFAEQCFKQLEGFSGYGFPESHAASFALLVYASAWIKCHYPGVYCCAILNSQPMGFYAPAQLVRDAREHGVEVRPACVNKSYWDNHLELDQSGQWAVRLGFRQIKGFRQEDAHFLSGARGHGYNAAEDLWRRAGIRPAALKKLADADAFHSLGLTRREALWQIKAVRAETPLPLFSDLEGENRAEPPVYLPASTLGEDIFEDYVSTRLTLREHPVCLLRDDFPGSTLTASALRECPNGRIITIAGLVITRQRPGTASGVIFITLEDETGNSNIIVWPKTFEHFRKAVIAGRLLVVSGKLQREGNVIHIIANRIEDRSRLLDTLSDIDIIKGRIDPTWMGADEVKRPVPLEKYWERNPESTPRAYTRSASEANAGKSMPHKSPASRPRHPRDQARTLFPSRDFH